MSIYSLAASARGMFIAMLVIMILVCCLFGFMMFMLLKTKKNKGTVNANDVKAMLARQESQLVVEIMKTKDGDAKKTELLNKLRRVKSAQMLIDELVKEEEAISGAIDAEEKSKKKSKVSDGAKPAEHRPAPTAQRPAQRSVGHPAQNPVKVHPNTSAGGQKPAEDKPENKPLLNKKDDNEFKPSED